MEGETQALYKEGKTVSTNLTRIGEKARGDLRMVLTSLYHHIADVDSLRDCYRQLEGVRLGDPCGGSKAGRRARPWPVS